MTREEEIRQAARNYFDNYMDGLKGEVLTVQQTFEDAAKWADEIMIRKACEWMKNEISNYVDYDGGIDDDLITDFKKAMEG